MSSPLSSLSRDEKRLAAFYVLFGSDLELGRPPELREIAEVGWEDVRRSIGRFANREPHRFANLLGALGGTGGAIAGTLFGRLGGDNRAAWRGTMVGAILGTYPPAIAGALIDKIID